MPSSLNSTLSTSQFSRLPNLAAGVSPTGSSPFSNRLTCHSTTRVASESRFAESITLPRATVPIVTSSFDIEHSLCRILQQSHRSRSPFGLLHVELASPDKTSSDEHLRDTATESIQPSIRLSDRIMSCGENGLLIALNDVNADMLLLFAAQVRRELNEKLNPAGCTQMPGIRSLTAILYRPSPGRPFTPARLLDEVQRATVAAVRSGQRTTVLHSIANGRSIPVTQKSV